MLYGRKEVQNEHLTARCLVFHATKQLLYSRSKSPTGTERHRRLGGIRGLPAVGGEGGAIEADALRGEAVWQSIQAYCRHLCQSRKPRWHICHSEGRWASQIAPRTSDSFQLAAGALLHGLSLHVREVSEPRQYGILSDKEGNEGRRDWIQIRTVEVEDEMSLFWRGIFPTVLSVGAQMTGMVSVMLFCHLVDHRVTAGKSIRALL